MLRSILLGYARGGAPVKRYTWGWMTLRRFLPDLALMVLALAATPVLLRLFRELAGTAVYRVAQVVLGAGAGLLMAGAGSVLWQALGLRRGYGTLAVSGLAFAWGVCIVLACAIGLVLRRWIASPTQRARRKLLAAASMAAMTAPAAIVAGGMFIGRRQFRLAEVDLPISGLAPDLDGLRLAQFTDIHLSPFLSRADLAWCVDMANEFRPHIAFVTGDLITGIRDSIDDCLDELQRLRVETRIFGCNGNHERYVGGETYTAVQAARRGIRFLRGEQETLRFGSALLNVAGVDHQDSPGQYLLGADQLRRPADLNLLMSHNPAVFREAAAQGWDLTLSGHLHGGQINLELANANLSFARFVCPWVYGTYREGASAIYVGRGIGTIGMPVRLGAPPEVAVIRLRRA